MIGVIAKTEDQTVISEFFELFKTPWEPHVAGRQYDVVLTTNGECFEGIAAKLILQYSGDTLDSDSVNGFEITSRASGSSLSYKDNQIPVFGELIRFKSPEPGVPLDEVDPAAIVRRQLESSRLVVRVGYNLFDEIRTLLTTGQPAAEASIPTVELHIAFLRDLIVSNCIQLIEIPPVPDGYRFIVCLTHDVDHPSILNHKLDHTMFGFLHRAALGSLVSWVRGRIALRTMLRNWLAVLKLPFVYIGIAKDFWSGFEDRYFHVEKAIPSTFFVIPFKNRSGKDIDGPAPAFRASGYAAREIKGAIERIVARGCEVGLHGIDAWCDCASAREEIGELQRLAKTANLGVRMHWLYYGEESASILDEAGAVFDSSIGYRETVGYRTGTTQAYKPFKATHLLELPMHVMDTALFYPSYMNLTQDQAKVRVRSMVDNLDQFGGCITMNWHDRSLAPERLWDECYIELLEDMRARGAWFATASQATDWFRMRRSATIEQGRVKVGMMTDRSTESLGALPGLQLRIHEADERNRIDFRKIETGSSIAVARRSETQEPARISR